MSKDEDKLKHSKRIHQKQNTVNKKVKVAKAYNWKHILTQPHRYLKCSISSCGNPKCIFCMNPRKSFNEKTIQERKSDAGVRADYRTKDIDE